ncbi:MAG: peptidoglycan DD-metalloendopeptidase family protein [Oscillospiraceae bacterium]|nr:peptidoglycan DD-metalloendopeptidase family protein [Oscillospiraceae bacterium]
MARHTEKGASEEKARDSMGGSITASSWNNQWNHLSDQAYRRLHYLGIQLTRSLRKLKRRSYKLAARLRLHAIVKGQKLGSTWARRAKLTKEEMLLPVRRVRHAVSDVSFKLSIAKQQGRAAQAKAAAQITWECVQALGRLCCSLLNYAAPAAAAVVLVVTVNHFRDMQFALSVEYNGEDIGYISDESVFEDAEKIMQGRIIYEDYEEPLDAVPRYSLAVVSDEELTSASALANELISASGNEIMEASGLYVDDTFLGAALDEGKLQLLLDGILDEHRTGAEDERVEFVKDIRFQEGLYPITSIVDYNSMADVLTSEVAGEVVYTVKAGDAPTLIAQEQDVPYSELKQLNPNIEEELFVGQEVLISRSEPFLKVKRVVTEVYDEEIPFTVNETVDTSQVRGYTKVVSYGQKGLKEVTADVVYIDGTETERTVLSTTVLKEPVAQEIVTGTAAPLANVPNSNSNSSFMWPVDGGYVSCGINGYWGHTGMDIATSRGTPIRAAASGTVVIAKQQGAYGIHVMIDHGNNVQTLYAHCSGLNVKVGDYVNQGDLIAYVGMTGRATGNHCHFEVRINGRYMDPAMYVGNRYPGR